MVSVAPSIGVRSQALTIGKLYPSAVNQTYSANASGRISMNSTANEAMRLAAWLQANAKHMGNPQEIDQMRRAALVMRLMSEELTRRDELQKPKVT